MPIRGNTLYLIITPSCSYILSSQPRTTSLFSDHYIPECDINLIKPRPATRFIRYRKLYRIVSESFSKNIKEELNCCDEISVFNSTVCSVLDKHVVVVYPLPWPLLVGGVRCSRLWSTSQLLRPSGQQCSHSGGVCPQIQGRQCGAYVGAVEEMMCVVCVDVTEGA